MGVSPLRFTQLLLCLQLINSFVGRTSAAESTGGLRIRELQTETEEVQELVGGYTANATLFPSFTLFANGECAGTLISPTRVLTAAHCVQSGHPTTVRVGASNRTNGHEVRVRCAKSHPLYDWPKFQYDLAVLKLDEAVNDVDLPILNSNTFYPAFEGQTLSVVGMGRVGAAEAVAETLQRLDYEFVSDTQCKATYGESVTLGLHVCAKGIREGSKYQQPAQRFARQHLKRLVLIWIHPYFSLILSFSFFFF